MDKFLKTNHWHLHLKSIKRFLGCNHLVQPWTYNFHDLSETLSMDLKLWEQNNQHTINIINPESFGFAVPHLHGVDLGSRCWHFLFAECWTENHRKMHPSNMHRGQPLAKTWCLIVVLLLGGRNSDRKFWRANWIFQRSTWNHQKATQNSSCSKTQGRTCQTS